MKSILVTLASLLAFELNSMYDAQLLKKICANDHHAQELLITLEKTDNEHTEITNQITKLRDSRKKLLTSIIPHIWQLTDQEIQHLQEIDIIYINERYHKIFTRLDILDDHKTFLKQRTTFIKESSNTTEVIEQEMNSINKSIEHTNAEIARYKKELTDLITTPNNMQFIQKEKEGDLKHVMQLQELLNNRKKQEHLDTQKDTLQ